MSRAEEITSEVRKLVLTCRAMEAQLQQSISKKTHQEVVSKMQETIDGLSADLDRTKTDLQNTISVGERVNSLISKVASQEETIASLSAQVSSQNNTIAELTSGVSNQKGAVEAQAKTIEDLARTLSQEVGALAVKLSQDTVPVGLYNAAQIRTAELEEKVRSMVERVEFNEVQKRCVDLAEQVSTMVPRAEYISLQAEFSNYVPRNQFEELERAYTNSVPKEILAETQARVADLEARIANSVPKADYEELTAKIASLTAMISTSSISLDSVTQSIVDTDNSAQQIQATEVTPITAASPTPEVTLVDAPASLTAPKGEPLEGSTVEAQPTVPSVELAATAEPSEASQIVADEVSTPEITQPAQERQEQVVVSQEPAAVPEPTQSASQEDRIEAVSEPNVPNIATDECNVAPDPTALSSSPSVQEVMVEQQPHEEQAPAVVVVANSTVAQVTAEVVEAPSAILPNELAVEIQTSEVSEQIATATKETEKETATNVPLMVSGEPQAVSIVAPEISSNEVSTAKNEIREVQSQLAEINSASETGATLLVVVEPTLGFNFTNTEYCARSGLEFLQDLERVSIEILESHARNGDFERWFKEVLQDEESAESLRAIREGNYSGEELRMKLVAAVAPRYRA